MVSTQALPDSGHQYNAAVSAFSLAQDGRKNGQVHPNLGPHPSLPGHVNTISYATKMRTWHLPEWGILSPPPIAKHPLGQADEIINV